MLIASGSGVVFTKLRRGAYTIRSLSILLDKVTLSVSAFFEEIISLRGAFVKYFNKNY